MVVLVLFCILFYDMQKVIAFSLKDWSNVEYENQFEEDPNLEFGRRLTQHFLGPALAEKKGASRKNTLVAMNITARMQNLSVFSRGSRTISAGSVRHVISHKGARSQSHGVLRKTQSNQNPDSANNRQRNGYYF